MTVGKRKETSELIWTGAAVQSEKAKGSVVDEDLPATAEEETSGRGPNSFILYQEIAQPLFRIVATEGKPMSACFAKTSVRDEWAM